jgi:hypothetical protein
MEEWYATTVQFFESADGVGDRQGSSFTSNVV